MFLITKFKDFVFEADQKELPPNRELSDDKNYVLMDADKHNIVEVAKLRLWFNKNDIKYEKFVDNKYSGFELETDDAETLKKIKDEVDANHKLFYTKYK